MDKNGHQTSKAAAKDVLGLVLQMEGMEGENCKLPLIFSETLKDEINANDEQKLYNGIKRIVKKYWDDKNAISAINEYTRVITGGASLMEILMITREEMENPTAVTDLTVDRECKM